MITRRLLISTSAIAAAAAASPARLFAAPAGAATAFEVTRTEDEWRKLLKPDRFTVLRKAGTERPYTSELLSEKRKGDFACAGCDLPLFRSTTKYDSGTGWPSFFAPIDDAVLNEQDSTLGMSRVAVNCRRCGGHLGHVFDDGPKPTGLRYCMNGLALTFKPDAAG